MLQRRASNHLLASLTRSTTHSRLERMRKRFRSMQSTRRVLAHSLLHSLARSHRSLIRLLRTACFARALCCAHSFARSLTRSLRSSWERGFCLWNECVNFIRFQPTVRALAVEPRRRHAEGRFLFHDRI